jgi:hypothetical protein
MSKQLANRVNVEDYRRMVAKAAWGAWRALPLQTRAWIEVEDMIEDGMFSVYHQLHRDDSYKYDRSRAAVSTFINYHISKFFINHYIEKYGADKQGWVYSKEKGRKVSIGMFSLQGMQENLRAENNKASLDDIVHVIPDLVVSPEHITQNALTECFVVPSLDRIYQASSDNLKHHLVDWLWYTKNKVHKKSRTFKSAAREFRKLCREEDLHCEDCLHIIRSPQCLDSLSRRLFQIPYDPGSDGCYPIVN